MPRETLECIKRSAVIPSLPAVAVRCYRLSQDADCNLDELVRLLGSDPGMATDVLRLANSSLFGAVRQVDSLRRAIGLLGLRRVRDLVLARYMVQALRAARTDPIDITYFWRRSLTSGVVSARLAARTMPTRRDDAFLAGLLGEIGVLILLQAIPQKYTAIASQYQPRGGDRWMEREYELLGVTHADVSALVLETWSLPPLLIETVRRFRSDPATLAADSHAAALANLVGAAHAIAVVLADALEPPDAAARCLQALERAGLDPADVVAVLPQIEGDIEALGGALGVTVIPGDAYHQVAAKIAAAMATPAA